MPSTPLAADRPDLERRVIEVVTELVEELRGGQSSPVTLRDSLERDLGISSLERVELLIRLERTFRVRLGDGNDLCRVPGRLSYRNFRWR